MGVGAGLATGCVVGNILSGWALMSVGMFLFGIAVILANWITTYFYLMNGALAELPGTFRLIFKRRRCRTARHENSALGCPVRPEPYEPGC